MRSTPLAEYRCTCGRLLFKGTVRTFGVEIKCRRCGAIRAFGTQADEAGRYGFVVRGGVIIAASESVGLTLGYAPQELFGMRLDTLQAYVPEIPGCDLPAGSAYVFHESHRTKQGSTVQVRVQRERAGTSATNELYLYDVLPSEPLLVKDAPGEGIEPRELVAEIDRESRCTYVSEALAGALGMRSFTCLGADFLEFLNPEDTARVGNALKLAPRLPFTAKGVRLAYLSSPSYRLHILPLRRDDGTFRGYALLFDT